VLSFVLGVVFLTGAVESHRLNPQAYDVHLPFLLLLFVVALDLFPSAKRPRSQRILAALCGVSLAMAELTRPFMVYLLPLLMLPAVGLMRGQRCLLYFFLPLILLSGTWHAHLAIRHHQLVWSNHAGFNLSKAWPMVDAPALVEERNDAPLQPGRRSNLNTDEHSENSRRLTRAVLAYVITHPVDATRNALRRLYALLYEVPIFYRVAGTPEVNAPFYRGFIRVCSLWWLVNLLALSLSILRRRAPAAWATGAASLTIAMTGLIFFLAVGELGEAFRFVLSILPLFAALPMTWPWQLGRADLRSPRPAVSLNL
jgi:hypothetical protein